jgi:hypothetical protein
MRCGALLGEYADEFFPAGLALHALEFGAEDIGGVFQADDQVGDVAFHDLLLVDHILDARILDIEIRVADLGIGLGELVEDSGRGVELAAHVVDRRAGFFDFCIEGLERSHIHSPWILPVAEVETGSFGATISLFGFFETRRRLSRPNLLKNWCC